MPRLIDKIVQKLPLNVYDAFNPRTTCRARIFTNANVGNVAMTNILHSGAMPVNPESDAILTNWYARTNITGLPNDVMRAWEAWTHSTVVTLTVGTSPVHSLNLSDLIGRRPSHEISMDDSPHAMPWSDERRRISPDPAVIGTAQLIAYMNNGALPDVLSEEYWLSLEADQRGRWIRIAASAMSVLRQPVLAVIPWRQTFDAIIEQDMRAHRALAEALPTDVVPQCLVWLHLEGFSRQVMRMRYRT